MSKPVEHVLIRRVAVAERVAQKFMGQTFAWGDRDCVRMAHLVVTGLVLDLEVKSLRDTRDLLEKVGLKVKAPKKI